MSIQHMDELDPGEWVTNVFGKRQARRELFARTCELGPEELVLEQRSETQCPGSDDAWLRAVDLARSTVWAGWPEPVATTWHAVGWSRSAWPEGMSGPIAVGAAPSGWLTVTASSIEAGQPTLFELNAHTGAQRRPLESTRSDLRTALRPADWRAALGEVAFELRASQTSNEVERRPPRGWSLVRGQRVVPSGWPLTDYDDAGLLWTEVRP